MNLQLYSPGASFRSQFTEMVKAYKEAGEDRYQEVDLSEAGFREYVAGLLQGAAGNPATPDLVPATTFWLSDGDQLIGVARLRHYLNPSLLVEGGHIGYDINPVCRRRGYGYRILQLALLEARKLGIARVLVTCDSDNTASRKIIEAEKGVLENETISARSGKLIRRYWIDYSVE